MAKELSYDEGVVGFSVLVSKDENILKNLAYADKDGDDKTFGLILGYPTTAVEIYGTDKKFDYRQELSLADLEKFRAEGILPFLLFTPSREHW